VGQPEGRHVSANVDWPTLLSDIAYLLGDPIPGNPHRNEPVGTPTLAKHLGLPRSTVRTWMDGAEPRHSDGERLIVIWCKLSGLAPSFKPLTKPSLSASKMKPKG
jgi:hypothetical protein